MKSNWPNWTFACINSIRWKAALYNIYIFIISVIIVAVTVFFLLFVYYVTVFIISPRYIHVYLLFFHTPVRVSLSLYAIAVHLNVRCSCIGVGINNTIYILQQWNYNKVNYALYRRGHLLFGRSSYEEYEEYERNITIVKEGKQMLL